MGEIRIGTCSWTDPTLIESAEFYPKKNMSAEARLKFYAEQFNTVEVDSTFYALPSEKVVGLQTTRTPDDFILNYKAFGLLTQHSIDPRRLPKAIKELLPEQALSKRLLRYQEVPAEAKALAFRMMESALRPVDSAGKLGMVLFQYPPYFVRRDENKRYILECKERLPQYRLAIEFRHMSWIEEGNAEDTFLFLKENDLTYVSVDEPQFPATLPPLAEATTNAAYVRFHGRNKDNWYKKSIKVAERFAYNYSDQDLEEWVPKIRSLQSKTKKTYLMFNNCYGAWAVRNAKRLAFMLD
jgi:uncharacterized protein YecE (DUF72 family)